MTQPEAILVADDNENDILLLANALRTANILNPVVGLSSSTAVIDHLAASPAKDHPCPCLLLLDVHLGIESGFNVLHWLRRNPPVHRLLSVILTGSASGDDVLQAHEYGADHILEKPLRAAEYPKLLDSIPGLRRERSGQGWVYRIDETGTAAVSSQSYSNQHA